MRALVQRVKSGAVTIEKNETRRIGPGLVILLGVTHDDTAADVKFLADKCMNLRIFTDEADKMNLSLLDVSGSALIISQFTLYGDCRKGRRPGFDAAAPPAHAIPLYEQFVAEFKQAGIPTRTGEFGAGMLVDIQNDGPVTLMVESKK